MDQKLYHTLKWIAILIAVVVVGMTIMQMIKEEYTGVSGLAFKTGHLRLEDGKFDEALQNFDEALKIDPNDHNAVFGRALSLMGLSKNKQALESLSKAITIKPDFAAAYANRGILHDRLGFYEDAVKDYRHALKLDEAMGEGPGYLTRFFRAQYEKPPTIADRATYIENELKKPVGKRVLRIPELDAKERSYKVEGSQ
jgi:tetratricopeptide (TPR) repeat protein